MGKVAAAIGQQNFSAHGKNVLAVGFQIGKGVALIQQCTALKMEVQAALIHVNGAHHTNAVVT